MSSPAASPRRRCRAWLRRRCWRRRATRRPRLRPARPSCCGNYAEVEPAVFLLRVIVVPDPRIAGVARDSPSPASAARARGSARGSRPRRAARRMIAPPKPLPMTMTSKSAGIGATSIEAGPRAVGRPRFFDPHRRLVNYPDARIRATSLGGGLTAPGPRTTIAPPFRQLVRARARAHSPDRRSIVAVGIRFTETMRGHFSTTVLDDYRQGRSRRQAHEARRSSSPSPSRSDNLDEMLSNPDARGAHRRVDRLPGPLAAAAEGRRAARSTC